VAKLIIRSMLEEDREFPLADRDLRIGRGEQNDIVLPDPDKAVSRFHAELRYENGAYVLADASSPNGIWVDGRRVAEVELQPGVEAVIGPYTLTVDSTASLMETEIISAPTIVSVSTPVPSRTMAPTMAPSFGATAQTQSRTQAPSGTQPAKAIAPKRSSKPSNAIWIGAAAVLLIVATVAIAFGLRRRAQRIADEQRRTEEQRLAQVALQPSPPSAPSVEAQVRQHLEQAQRLYDSRQFDDADAEINRVFELDASNAAATQLHEKIQTARNPLPSPTAGQGQGRGSGSGGSTPANPQAASTSDAKAKALQERYELGKQALLGGEYQTAIKQLEAVLRDDPNYRDTAFLLDQTRMALQRDEAHAAAKKAEVAGELPTALKLYLDAQKLGAADQEDVTRVRGRMTTEGADAFSRAKQYYAFRQFDRALPLYQRAYQYLPDSDPNRKAAKDRVDELTTKH
jgi:predicted component of type VI protein secretion system